MDGPGVPSAFVRGIRDCGTPRLPSDCKREVRFIENWEGWGAEDSDWRLSILEKTVRARAVRVSRCGVVGRTGDITGMELDIEASEELESLAYLLRLGPWGHLRVCGRRRGRGGRCNWRVLIFLGLGDAIWRPLMCAFGVDTWSQLMGMILRFREVELLAAPRRLGAGDRGLSLDRRHRNHRSRSSICSPLT
jgi:hypothetical protein